MIQLMFCLFCDIVFIILFGKWRVLVLMSEWLYLFEFNSKDVFQTECMSAFYGLMHESVKLRVNLLKTASLQSSSHQDKTQAY
jgi:hypothetical protein